MHWWIVIGEDTGGFISWCTRCGSIKSEEESDSIARNPVLSYPCVPVIKEPEESVCFKCGHQKGTSR